MCFTSLVMQQFDPYIPQPQQWQQWPVSTPSPAERTYTVDELGELLAAFRKAYEAAEKFDALTGQPDCIDPEKAKLIERVAELEAKLAAIAEEASA
jgi:hypothetical protein